MPSPTLAMDFSQYTQRPANTGFGRMHRSHVEIRELPVLADRVVPVQTTHHKIQFSPEQVDEFVQSLPRMKNSSLGEEERICSICAFEYGDVRGILAAPVSGKGKNIIMPYSDLVDDEGLPGEELPEAAAKLPCGHVYGDWCIKTWLLEQPATCPACRYCFQPVWSR